MSATLLAEVVDGLIATFSAALTVPVFDGPPLQPPSDRQFLIVGGTEVDGTSGEDAQSDSNRSSMGNGELRDDSGFVTCAAWAWSGELSCSDLRRTALGLVDQCAAAIRADPTLGGVLQFGHYVDIGSSRLRQQPEQNGAQVSVVFSITYTALLT